ncbi:hypothetical protein BV502_06195 [Leucobacter sp. OAMLP11]|uniref:FHA domain-containing protein n=1 Tax=unclassified Leucobacter TaxID=2621730 RepID=UPI000C180EC6|nr:MULTISPECIES: FHA domain-containing protein [unclassified Leucobacter]PIO51082.1 hypothetical protein BV502_06195 [Leucobacter sp. OAMLP11]
MVAKRASRELPCPSCGFRVPSRAAACPRCGVPIVRAAPKIVQPRPYRGPFTLASAGRIIGAMFVDVLAPVLPVLLLAPLGAVALAVFLCCAVLLLQLAGFLRRGRSLGCLVWGIRAVSAETGSAPGARLSGLRFARVRGSGAHDPLDPYWAVPALPAAPAPLRAPASTATDSASAAVAVQEGRESPSPDPGTAAPVPPADAVSGLPEDLERTAWVASPLRQGAAVLVIDDEVRLPTARVMLIGRNPSQDTDADAVAVAVPDLHRELSKVHFRLDQAADGTMSITDLASTNGTFVEEDELVAHVPRVLRVGERVFAGGHRLRVEPRTRTHELEAR